MPNPLRKPNSARAVAWLASWCVLSLALSGCPQSAAPFDPLSPRADVRITKLAAPGGGALLAPVVSTGPTAGATPTAVVEFPPVAVDVTVFNGVSLSLTELVVEYRGEDGATPLGIQPLRAGLALFLQAQSPTGIGRTDTTFEPTTLTVTLPLVSGELRSVFAGPDGLLATNDDFLSPASALVTIVGRDINGHEVAATGRVTVTARPQAEP